MNFGKMDRKVILQVATRTPNDFGEVEESFATLAEVWAMRIDKIGKEIMDAGTVQAQIQARFIIRYRSDVDETAQVVDGNEVFDIIQVREIQRRAGLELTCIRERG